MDSSFHFTLGPVLQEVQRVLKQHFILTLTKCHRNFSLNQLACDKIDFSIRRFVKVAEPIDDVSEDLLYVLRKASY